MYWDTGEKPRQSRCPIVCLLEDGVEDEDAEGKEGDRLDDVPLPGEEAAEGGAAHPLEAEELGEGLQPQRRVELAGKAAEQGGRRVAQIKAEPIADVDEGGRRDGGHGHPLLRGGRA